MPEHHILEYLPAVKSGAGNKQMSVVASCRQLGGFLLDVHILAEENLVLSGARLDMKS